jgi:glycosyltransferase involved in cell wall biosynthesis
MSLEAPDRQRKRVLIVAFACHPDENMETRIGWKRALAASKSYDTTVLHSADFDSESLASLAADHGADLKYLRFVAIGSIGSSASKFSDLMYWAGYRSWQRRAFQCASEMQRRNGFDLVHLVSYCGYREPGYWWRLGIPFIWGPVGGTQNFPSRFVTQVAFLSGLRELARNVLNTWQLRLSPRVKLSARHAATVFAASSTAQRDLKRATGVHCPRLLETAIGLPAGGLPAGGPHHNDSNGVDSRVLDTDRPFRLLWAGRLREWKALPLLLKAVAQLPPGFNYELRVLGVGASEKRWRRLAERLGVADKTRWVGWGAYEDTMRQYEWADAFVFTSLRDTSGTGLLESLAAGTPIIGVDHQGAADIMTPECGIAIPVEMPSATIRGFRDAILRLAGDRATWKRLSDGARRRASDYTWDRLSEKIEVAYRAAFSGRALCDEQAGEQSVDAASRTATDGQAADGQAADGQVIVGSAAARKPSTAVTGS